MDFKGVSKNVFQEKKGIFLSRKRKKEYQREMEVNESETKLDSKLKGSFFLSFQLGIFRFL